MQRLGAQAQDVQSKVHALATQYAGEDAETLMGEKDVVLEPQPARTPRVERKRGTKTRSRRG